MYINIYADVYDETNGKVGACKSGHRVCVVFPHTRLLCDSVQRGRKMGRRTVTQVDEVF